MKEGKKSCYIYNNSVVYNKLKLKKVKIMKKYVVPAMKLHKLKTSSILADSSQGKETFDRSSANTEKFDVDDSFDSNSFFEN